MGIPYEHIDIKIRTLIKTMNESGIIKTYGSCAGHGKHPKAAIIFNVLDDLNWQQLKVDLLNLSYLLSEANINIYQWHRLNEIDGQEVVDWIIQIEAHPDAKKPRKIINTVFKEIESLIN